MQTPTSDSNIREEYEEYTENDRTVARISDPENDAAWVESTVTHTVSR
jgi:hypothetical protein